MALNKIKEQVLEMLQSVLSLDSTDRAEAMEFLKDSAINFGLQIPEKKENNNVPLLPNSIKNFDYKESETVLYNEFQNSNMNVVPNDKVLSDDKNEDVNIVSPKIDSSIDEAESNIKDGFSDSDHSEFEIDLGKLRLEENINSTTNNETSQVEEKKYGRIFKTKRRPREITLKTDFKINEDIKKSKRMKKKKAKKEDQENDTKIFKCPECMTTCDNKPALLVHFTSHPETSMSCRLCRSTFNNVLHFWRHQKKKECKVSLFKCSECGEKFKYRRHYLKHVLGHNDNNCRYCDEKFSTWLHYKHHLKKKHPDIKMERDLIPCKFCAMSFRRHLGLYNHYQIEHSKGKFVCLSCGLLLPTKEKYKEHSLIHESEKTWKCKICKMKFYRRQQLLFHVSVHKKGTYTCLTCNITVTSKVDLSKHKKDGHEVKGLEPKFECEICHKPFKTKVVLKNHMETHSNEKKYYCKYCVKNFSTAGALQKHQKRKSHFEKAKIILPESKYEKVYEDKFICENCGKQYKTQRELTWHLRVHKSIYDCHECGKTFTLKVNLTKHIKLHRNKVCVVCELCGNTFNQLSALNEHNLMKHSDVRNAECEVCKKKFKRKSELNRHMRIHEQKRPFACFCGTTFNQSSHLQTHYKNFHEKAAEQNHIIPPENFTNNQPNEVYNNTIIDRQKPMYNNEHSGLLPLDNIEANSNFRNPTYTNLSVPENHENKASYVNSYPLRYSHNEIDSINVTYEDLSFATQPDKRDLDFTSPAVDLSMVAISEVVQNEMTLGGPRDIAESVESFNKIPDDSANMQLVNLSEHIVQEYLLNLP